MGGGSSISCCGVRHRIDGLENTQTSTEQNNFVRHRIDGLESQDFGAFSFYTVRHCIDGL